MSRGAHKQTFSIILEKIRNRFNAVAWLFSLTISRPNTNVNHFINLVCGLTDKGCVRSCVRACVCVCVCHIRIFHECERIIEKCFPRIIV